jgi:tetraacyldisaccharide 4'-kinase
VARRGQFRRGTRWLWTSPRLEARLVRALLVPASLVWRHSAGLRRLLLGRGAPADLAAPVIGVDNLTLGGSGQGAVVRWLAVRLREAGAVPGVLLSDHSSRQAALVRRAAPEAAVQAGGPRGLGGRAALARGATVLVADDVLEEGDLRWTKLLVVLAAESGVAVPWTVPAGPWREPLSAVTRADAVVITRRRATPEAAAELAARIRTAGFHGPVAIADLGLRGVEGLVSGRRMDASVLTGRRVVAAAGFGDPDAFAAPLKALGAQVQVAVWKHADAPRDEDVAWLAHAARKADSVVVPESVAVALRERWPAMVPEPLVALAGPTWESGEEAVLGAFLADPAIRAALAAPPPPSGE